MARGVEPEMERKMGKIEDGRERRRTGTRIVARDRRRSMADDERLC
jgi:hypothetical protein